MLNQHGNVKAEATIANLPAGNGAGIGTDTGTGTGAGARVWYGSAAASEFHDFDWLSAHLPDDGSVQLKSLTNDYTILLLAGPKARDVLQATTRLDCSADGFEWLGVRTGFVGIAPAVIMAVSFSGEQAFEIHVPNNQLYAAWLALRAAGEPHDLRLFGSMAVESMRMEKGYLHWKADLITEFNPFETGLDRFVKMDKEFIGKSALQKMVAAGPRKCLVALEIDCDHAPAHGGASVYTGDRLVGTVTSAAWGYRVSRNLAYAFVDPGSTALGTDLTVDVMGRPQPARVIAPSPYDPDNRLVRGR